eukprot:GFUD01001496.1.p1 GENE.GFUD01001496.1~~GFUD01001496.1.p1  ORF type:complete len:344 (+),score=75.50 GFUD01001496.1:211-1242(+)
MSMEDNTEEERIEMIETSLNTQDTPENRIQEFVIQGWRIFAETAEKNMLVAREVRKIDASTGGAVMGVATGAAGAAVGVTEAGHVGKVGGNWIERKLKQKDAKSMGRLLAGFDRNDSKWIEIVTSAFEEIFLSYNLQLISILKTPMKNDSWDRIMYKVAKDCCYRMFSKLPQIEDEVSMTKELLTRCFVEGQSEGLIKHGRTIQVVELETGKKNKRKHSTQKYTTQQLFDKPAIKRGSQILSKKNWREPKKSKYWHRRMLPHEEEKTNEELIGKNGTVCELEMFMENSSVFDYFEQLSNRRSELHFAIIEKIKSTTNKAAYEVEKLRGDLLASEKEGCCCCCC